METGGPSLSQVRRVRARGINRSFLSRPSCLPRIKGLGQTETQDETGTVLGGFWSSVRIVAKPIVAAVRTPT